MATLRPARTSRSPFRSVDIWFVLLIPAALLAFAKSYFGGVTLSGKAVTVLLHVHTALMVLWLLMLIAQAWFIRTKRFQLHRWVGRSSYAIAPIIIMATLIADHELLNRSPEGITVEGARNEVFAWGQLLERCKFKRSGLGVGEASVARRAKQAYSWYVDAARQSHAQA
jgi:hypothetical protein